ARATRARSSRPATVTLSRTASPVIRAPASPRRPGATIEPPGGHRDTRPVYHEIRTPAFTPVPGAQPFTGLYPALAFPRHWRQAILDLYRHGKNNPDKYK